MKRHDWLPCIMVLSLVSLSACFDPLVGEECATGYAWCNDECTPIAMCFLGDAGTDSQETGDVEAGQGVEVGDALSPPVEDTLKAPYDAGADTYGFIDAAVNIPDVPPDIVVVLPVDTALDIPVDSWSLPTPDVGMTPDSEPDASIALTPDLAPSIDLPPDTSPDTPHDRMLEAAPDSTFDTAMEDSIVDSAGGIEVPPDTPRDDAPDAPAEDVPQQQDGPCIDCSETLDTLVVWSPSLLIRQLV